MTRKFADLRAKMSPEARARSATLADQLRTPVRLRVPELLRARGITAYVLATRSEGRISMSTAYYFARTGTFRCLKPDQLEALCEVLEVEPGELFERRRKKA